MCRGHFLPETDSANHDGDQLVVCLTQVTQVKPRVQVHLFSQTTFDMVYEVH